METIEKITNRELVQPIHRAGPKDWTITITRFNEIITLHIPFDDLRKAMELFNKTLNQRGIKSYITEE